jgi:hypothetical protein
VTRPAAISLIFITAAAVRVRVPLPETRVIVQTVVSPELMVTVLARQAAGLAGPAGSRSR